MPLSQNFRNNILPLGLGKSKEIRYKLKVAPDTN